MDEACKELDELKAAMKRLTADYHAKAELSESLKKAHSEQLVKVQEAKTEIEKQAQELSAQRDEISHARQMYEELKSDLHEKESMLRHLSSANNQLRTNCDEKLQKLETENRKLVSALDESNAKTEDQGQKIRAYKEEIEDLKGLLSILQKKCLDAEERAKAPMELKQREDMLMTVEQEKWEISDRLKWRNEQFDHLEEAHEKLQDQFRESKEEWELEKSTLLNEVCSLQMNLESQTRVSEGFRSQLQMCNHALAQEESRRKLLEIQLSESQKCYENVVAEYQGAQSMIESLTARRDGDIAALRDSLAMKETIFKEMEFIKARLEQENQELLGSLKELREAQISQAGAAPLSKFRQKLRVLEQVHKDCSAVLKAKEAEWSCKAEKMEMELNECRLELNSKDKQIEELQSELEGCHSLMMRLKAENEEISMMLMVMKSEFSKAHSELRDSEAETELCSKKKDEKMETELYECRLKLSSKDKQIEELQTELEGCHSLMMRLKAENEEISMTLMVMKTEFSKAHSELRDSEAETELCSKRKDEQISSLTEQLEKKNNCLLEALAEIEREREMKASLMQRVESSDCNEHKLFLMQKEIEKCKEMLQESSHHQDRLKEQASNRESSLREDLRKVSDALDKASSDLAEKTNKESEINFQLERLKPVAEQMEASKLDAETQLKACHDENRKMQKELEATVLAKMESEETFKQEKALFLQNAADKDENFDDLRRQLNLLEQEYARRETEASVLAYREAEKTFMREKESFLRIMEEKDKRIEDLRQQFLSLEQQYKRRETETSVLVKEAEKDFMQEKERFLRIVEEKGKMVDKLQQQIVLLEQESVKRETEAAIFARKEADKTFNEEKDGFLHIAADKDNRIDDLQKQIMSLGQELTNSVKMKQSEIDTLYKAWENISADWILSQLEIEERKHLIAEQEEEFDELKRKLEMEEKSLSELKKLIEQLEAELVLKRLEREREMGRYEEILRGLESTVLILESQVEDLKAEKRALLEVNARLELEKDELVDQMIGFCDQLDGFSRKDAELMVSLERITRIAENENIWYKEEEKNINSHSKRIAKVSNDERSPLKILNS
ncbi:uncharacterized protein At4g38062 [Magnolia sinica]|uniref:uncharacterized protein At4g38062 n=1 Tax=Magnolia sinica TaxID=86752 RepID=UPI002657D6E0|nr:uncharacterized protein At4g38062 [Magnolia sinica]